MNINRDYLPPRHPDQSQASSWHFLDYRDYDWFGTFFVRCFKKKSYLYLFRITKVSDRGSGATVVELIMQIKMKVFRPCSAELLDNSNTR